MLLSNHMHLQYVLKRDSLPKRKQDGCELFETYIFRLIGFYMQYLQGDKICILARRNADIMYELRLATMGIGFELSFAVIMTWMRQAQSLPAGELCSVETRMWGIDTCEFASVHKKDYSVDDYLVLRNYDKTLRWTYTNSNHINLLNFEHFSKKAFYKDKRRNKQKIYYARPELRSSPNPGTSSDPYEKQSYHQQPGKRLPGSGGGGSVGDPELHGTFGQEFCDST